VPIPPITLQNRFSLFKEKLSRIKEKQLSSTISTDLLFTSLMSQAFKGKLKNITAVD
jgi:hypothetical protein